MLKEEEEENTLECALSGRGTTETDNHLISFPLKQKKQKKQTYLFF